MKECKDVMKEMKKLRRKKEIKMKVRQEGERGIDMLTPLKGIYISVTLLSRIWKRIGR